MKYLVAPSALVLFLAVAAIASPDRRVHAADTPTAPLARTTRLATGRLRSPNARRSRPVKLLGRPRLLSPRRPRLLRSPGRPRPIFLITIVQCTGARATARTIPPTIVIGVLRVLSAWAPGNLTSHMPTKNEARRIASNIANATSPSANRQRARIAYPMTS